MNIETKRYILQTWEEYSQFLFVKKFNWSTFHFINMEFEFDKWTGGLEFMFIIIGLGVRLRIHYDTKESEKFWKKTKKDMDRTLNKSCHAYVNKKEYEEFSKGKKEYLYIYKKRLTKKERKLFIQ